MGMRQIVHSQEGQIILGSKVNWMKDCRRRIDTESFVARPWVGEGTWVGTAVYIQEREGWRAEDDQCSASAPGSWLAGLHMARGKPVICIRFQQIASKIIEQC